MSETYQKKDKDSIIITRIENNTNIIEESREEIQTQLARLELNKSEIQKQIDKATSKIALLDS